MDIEESVQKVIRAHEVAGKYTTVDNYKIFYRDEGTGEVVFCIHGVPTSSFLYRKVVGEIARRGMRAVAPDLPGLGLSARPEAFEYLFSNFARVCRQLLDQLGIASFHLVVHDIGAPIGMALAAQNPERVQSITVLNSMLDIQHFTKPLPMRPFEKPVLGEAELATLNYTTWNLMMKYSGVEDTDTIRDAELGAYMDLLKREDGGKAFLKIMRNFEQTEEFSRLCYSAIHGAPYPIQLIWGKNDRFLDYDTYAQEFLRAAPKVTAYQVESKHFLQEDYPEFIAEKVVEQARGLAI
ncbi:alpha/beta fold hydrolase [Telluribacter humicola]|uniref:alpha/beta fold hydrolase n=1 Tax=Telluribacter humicola TaxID=1720261 RepID=UPI001A9732D8|nr:alpha/beta hydrolase [Telluribacter humicola]